MPTKKLWNHAIKVKEGFASRKGKIYPLSREKRGKVHEFIEEQLRKGYIKCSKTSQIVLVFFVRKKNSKYMIQDYKYLNKWTIKNNYPLSLISDIV